MKISFVGLLCLAIFACSGPGPAPSTAQPPAQPSNPIATAVIGQPVVVSWDQVENATRYRISLVGGTGEWLAAPAQTVLRDSLEIPLSSGSGYAFQIAAVNDVGSSPATTTAPVDVVCAAPSYSRQLVAELPWWVYTLSAAVGPFGSDGGLRIAAVYSGSQQISLTDPTYDTTYATPDVLTMTGSGATTIASVDVNWDGLLDLVVDSQPGGEVFINQGDGGFLDQVLDAGGSIQGIAIADVNGDGHPDVILGATEGFTNVLFSSSQGLRAPMPYAFGPALNVADMNADGWPDLVSSAGIAYNQADGGFALPVAIPPYPERTGFAAVDLDGDGIGELIFTSRPDGMIVLAGLKDGGFGAPRAYATNTEISGIRIADINGDGYPDVLLLNHYDGVEIAVNAQDGGLFPPRLYGGGDMAWDVTVADVDGDGRVDLVVPDNLGTNEFAFAILRNDGCFWP